MARDKALKRAIKIAGGNSALGTRLGISREAVRQWSRCPADRVIAVVEATGGQVSPEELRPDIFRRPAIRASVPAE